MAWTARHVTCPFMGRRKRIDRRDSNRTQLMVNHAFNTFSFQQSSPNQFAGRAQQAVARVLSRDGRRLLRRAVEHRLSRGHINMEREY